MSKALSTLALLLFVGSGLTLHAQIGLAPSFVFIDENSGVGNLYLSNRSEQPFEVSVSFLFGYPDSDAEGNLVMNYDDPAAFAAHGLDSMIRVFPRSFVLREGEQRTVRIHVIPDYRNKEGFFYTRLKVMAKPLTPEVTGEVTEGIGTRISFNFEQVTAVFYKRGQVSTGLAIKQLDAIQVDTILQLRTHLQRLGNAPFLGSMIAKLKDAAGNTVAETQSTTTAYFDVIRRMDLNVSRVPAGQYTLEMTFETRRNDMMASDIVQAPMLVHKAEVVLK